MFFFFINVHNKTFLNILKLAILCQYLAVAPVDLINNLIIVLVLKKVLLRTLLVKVILNQISICSLLHCQCQQLSEIKSARTRVSNNNKDSIKFLPS